MAINKVYAGGAVLATTVGSMTPVSPGGGGTFTVTDDTGYPASGAFPVKINRGLSDEEHILVASRSGTTFTVSQRGFDGTTAQSHDAGATVEIYMDAVSMNLVVDHVDDDEADPHSTKLLNEARHALVTHTAAMLGVDSVGSSELANNAVDTAAIVDDAVTSAKIADLNIITALINDLAVTAAKLADLAVTTAKLNNLAVTSAKLAADAVTAGKIADGGVSTTAELADAIITMAKMATEDSGSYVPTFTNVTLGSSARYGRYWKFGKLVLVLAGFQLGGVGDVTGKIEVSLPFPPEDRSGGAFNIPITGGVTAATARDDSSSLRFSGLGTIRSDTGTATDFVVAGAGTGWNATLPFNWTNQDSLEIIAVYESTT